MSKQSGLLRRQREREEACVQAGIRIGLQYAVDTLNVSLHELAGWGFDRQQRLMDVWRENRAFYAPSLDHRNVECDVYREKLDRSLRAVIDGKMELISYRDRYPDLGEVRYDRRGK